jgi:hypothetical protein
VHPRWISVAQRDNLDQARLIDISLPKPDVIPDQTLICTEQLQDSVEGSTRSYWMMERIPHHRLLPLATTYYLVQCCCEISLPLISIIRLLSFATRFTTHARGLLYFTNYHIHGYGGFGLYNKTFDESKHHTRRVFIGQRAAYIDWKHQQNKPNKGLSEKIESSKKSTRA